MRLPRTFQSMCKHATTNEELMLRQFPFLIPIFFQRLPTSTMVRFRFLLTAPQRLANVDSQRTIRIMVFSSSVVPIGSVTMFIGNSQARDLHLRGTLYVSLLRSVYHRILVNRATIDGRANTRYVSAFSLNLLTPFLRFYKFKEFLLQFKIRRCVRFTHRMVTYLRRLRIFYPLRVIRQFFTFCVQTARTFRGLFNQESVWLLLSVTFETFTFVFNPPFT